MLSVRFTVSKRYTRIVLIIVLLSEIVHSYSRYIKKKLLYITIAALFSCQPSSYIEYTKSNIYSTYNIRFVLNTKYIFLTRPYSL